MTRAKRLAKLEQEHRKAEQRDAPIRIVWGDPTIPESPWFSGKPGSISLRLQPHDAPVTPPEWFSDDLARADATVDAALAAGVEVDPALVATRRRRGQRPRAVEPTLCDGADPHCQGCRDIAAVMYSRRQARERPRTVIGMNFNPLLYGRAW